MAQYTFNLKDQYIHNNIHSTFTWCFFSTGDVVYGLKVHVWYHYIYARQTLLSITRVFVCTVDQIRYFLHWV